MILVDSCGWLEYFADGPLADKYYRYLAKTNELIVPTIILYEVYRKIKKERKEEAALLAVALMQCSRTIPLKENIALLSADISIKYSLPMADAIVYSTALSENSKLVTSDEHFEDLEHVEFIS